MQKYICSLVLASGVLGYGQASEAAFTSQRVDRPGYASTFFLDINNSGQIVGTSIPNLNENFSEGFVYQSGVFEPIAGPTSAVYVSARGISDTGTIVGFFNTDTADNAPQSGFILNSGQYTTFIAPDSTNTVLMGISPNGRYITGIANTEAIGSTGFVYDKIHQTYSFSGPGTTLKGIRDDGTAVGAQGASSSFLFDSTTQEKTHFGQRFQVARDINLTGTIVGINYGPEGLPEGILYGTVQNWAIEPFPEQAFGAVVGINDSGIAVGYWSPDGMQQRGYIASPVPEPMQVTLYLVGLLVIAVRAQALDRSRGAA